LKVYRFNNFMINRANKQYNHLSHDFEIKLTKDSIIHEINDDVYLHIGVIA